MITFIGQAVQLTRTVPARFATRHALLGDAQLAHGAVVFFQALGAGQGLRVALARRAVRTLAASFPAGVFLTDLCGPAVGILDAGDASVDGRVAVALPAVQVGRATLGTEKVDALLSLATVFIMRTLYAGRALGLDLCAVKTLRTIAVRAAAFDALTRIANPPQVALAIRGTALPVDAAVVQAAFRGFAFVVASAAGDAVAVYAGLPRPALVVCHAGKIAVPRAAGQTSQASTDTQQSEDSRLHRHAPAFRSFGFSIVDGRNRGFSHHRQSAVYVTLTVEPWGGNTWLPKEMLRVSGW
jgi:hypothetical protein